MAIHTSLFSSATDDWYTPIDLYESLNKEFDFTLDPCATRDNAKCTRYYTKQDDGLAQDWSQETVFCNPPYGRTIGKWAEKAYKSSLNGATVVFLVPARTDTKWFHDWVYGKADIRFLRGRLKFGGAKANAPFPSLIAIYRPSHS